MNKIKLGVLRETKNPPDKRVPITPSQVVKLTERFPDVDVFIQPAIYDVIQMKNINTWN